MHINYGAYLTLNETVEWQTLRSRIYYLIPVLALPSTIHLIMKATGGNGLILRNELIIKYIITMIFVPAFFTTALLIHDRNIAKTTSYYFVRSKNYSHRHSVMEMMLIGLYIVLPVYSLIKVRG